MATSALSRTIAPESFVWVLESLSRDIGLPFALDLMLRVHPPPHDCCALQTAVRALGMEAALIEIDAKAIDTGEEAWFALLSTESAAKGGCSAHDLPEPSVLSVARIRAGSDGWVHMRHHRSPTEVSITREDFSRLYLGFVLRARPAQSSCGSDLDLTPIDAKFGLGWFAREMLRYRSVWRDVLVASLFIQLLAVFVPLLTQTVIDKVMTHRTFNTLAVIAVALLLVTSFSAVLSWLRQYYVVHAGTRIDAVLAADVFSHLLRLPVRYFEQRSTGVLVARMHGVETVREFMTGAALTLLLDVPFMLLFAAIMLYYSPLLTAVAGGLLALIVLMSVLGTPPLRRRIDEQFLAGARHQSFVTERLAAIETVKSLQLEPVLERRFEALYARYLEAGVHTRLLSASLAVGAHAIEQALSLSVLCVGAWLVLQGSSGLTVGALIAFQMFAARLSAPALRMVQLWQEFQQVHVAVRRLADIKDLPREPMRESPTGAVRREGHLQCRGVGFRYGDRPWLFRGLSLDLRPGGCAALIGGSGSGKSTFARLLQGFYLPLEGSMTLDGVDIRRMAANELRAFLGVVPQETRLFSGTVLENLLEAAPGAAFADVVAACGAAGVHAAIEMLPDGYLSRLGENGTGLSGGQKQRLAIARAMLKGARILVFDEATSSLDPELAEGLVETINALRGRTSVLFIGHRLPERLKCDTVVRIESVDAEAAA